MQNRPLLRALALTIFLAGLPGYVGAQVQPPENAVSPAPSAADRYLLDAWISKFAPAFSSAADARYLLHVEVSEVLIYDKPSVSALVVGRLERGIEVEADLKTGEWYRIKRASGEAGWVLNVTFATGAVISVRPFPIDRRIGYEAGAVDPRVAQSLPPETLAERTEAAKPGEPRIDRQRPQGTTFDPRFGRRVFMYCLPTGRVRHDQCLKQWQWGER